MPVFATYVCEVDWNADGDFLDAQEDITGDVIRMEWTRGRDYASQLTGRSVGGVLLLDLDDRDGKYASFNTASAIVTAGGSIVPGRKVRVRTTAPSAATLWTGFLRSVLPGRAASGEKTARLEAVGPLGLIGEKKVRAARLTSVRTDVAIGAILDDVGWPAGDRSLDTGDTTITRWYAKERLCIDALRDVELSEGGFIQEAKDGKIAFERRQHRLLGTPHTTVQATFSDAAGAARTYREPVQEDPLLQIFNIFRAGVQLYTVGALQVLWTLAETGAASPKIVAGQTKTFIAKWPTADATNQDDAVDAWTTPVATTDWTANSAADGSGTDLTASLTAVVVKSANHMEIALTNGHATLDAYVTFLQARGTPVTKNDLLVIEAKDATSQTAYGQREWPSPGPYIPNSQEAEDWCRYNLAIYKDPAPVIGIHVVANKDSTHMTEVLTREIGDRITVVATNNAKLGISQDFFIENEHHTVEPGRFHTVEWGLSPIGGSASVGGFGKFWVMDVSKLDTETVLAY